MIPLFLLCKKNRDDAKWSIANYTDSNNIIVFIPNLQSIYCGYFNTSIFSLIISWDFTFNIFWAPNLFTYLSAWLIHSGKITAGIVINLIGRCVIRNWNEWCTMFDRNPKIFQWRTSRYLQGQPFQRAEFYFDLDVAALTDRPSSWSWDVPF